MGRTGRGDSRRAHVLGALLLLVAGAAGLVLLADPHFDVRPDSSLYVATARSLLAGDGYTYLGEPFIVRPPGFSVLLAVALAACGPDALCLNLSMGLYGIACALLLYAFLIPRLGTPLAYAVAQVVMLSPAFQEASLRLLSDVPGAVGVLACLLLDRRCRAGPPRAAREITLGLAVAAATYVRMVNFALLPAIILSRVLAHGVRRDGWMRLLRERLLLVAIVPILALMPWWVRNALVQAPAPALQLANYSTGTGMWHEDQGDPGSRRLGLDEIAARVPGNAKDVLSALGDRVRNREHEPRHLLLGILGMTAVVVVFLRRRDSAELYVLGTFAVLCVYYSFNARLVLPHYLLALPAVVELVLLIPSHVASPTARRALALLLLVSLATVDFDPDRRTVAPREAVAQRDAAFVIDARRLGALLPGRTPLAASVGWHLALYLDRPVYSLRYIGERKGLAAMLETLREHDIHGVVVNENTPEQLELLEYLTRAVGEPRRMASGFVFLIEDPSALPELQH